MAEDRNDGGPAFPPVHNPETHESGMTLRDWFAGQALAGIAGPGGGERFSLSEEDSAAWAYQYADAMLAERDR